MVTTTEAVPSARRRPGLTFRRLRPRWFNVTGIGFLLTLAVIWQLVMTGHLFKSQYLPTPLQIVSAISSLAQSGALTTNFGHTLYVALVGWLGSAVLGMGIGLLLGLSPTTWRYSMASFEFLRALPAISFVPVAVLLLGFSVKMELVVVAYVSIWPVLIATIHGARQVTPLHNDLAAMLHMSRLAKVRRLVIPTTAPFVFVGLQISLALALALALVAEMVGNPTGVGQALIVAQNTLHPPEMFAYVILVGVAGVVLNAALVGFIGVAFPGTYAARGEQ